MFPNIFAQSKGQIWLPPSLPLPDVFGNVKSRLSFAVPSSALQACTWPSLQRGPRHRRRLFVCACLFRPPFLFSAIKLLHEVCLKTNCVLSDEEKNCYIQSIVLFLGGGGHQGHVQYWTRFNYLDASVSDSRLWLYQMWSQVLSNFKKGPHFSIAQQPLVLPTLSICKYPQTYMYSEIWVKKKNPT